MSTASEKHATLRWVSNGVTHPGKVRKHNEDAVLDRGEIGLWAVADGMGGHAAGDVASNMIVSDLKKVHEGLSLERYIEDVEEQLLQVNGKLIKKSQEATKRTTIGSTVVVMLAYEDYCIYMWAGDSRLYRTRSKKLNQITVDHSQVQLYVEQGLITREEAGSAPPR